MQRLKGYRYAESCMYRYKSNLQRLRELSAELDLIRASGDVKAQSYEHYGHSNDISKPVEELLELIEKREHKLRRLEGEIIPVLKLLEELTNGVKPDQTKPKLILLTEYYFRHKSITEVESLTGLSRKKIYIIRRHLVHRVMKLSKAER